MHQQHYNYAATQVVENEFMSLAFLPVAFIVVFAATIIVSYVLAQVYNTVESRMPLGKQKLQNTRTKPFSLHHVCVCCCLLFLVFIMLLLPRSCYNVCVIDACL
jgi:hypothetical protein